VHGAGHAWNKALDTEYQVRIQSANGQRNAAGQPPERESPRLSLTPATQPLPRTLLPLLAAGKKEGVGGLATACPSDRLLLRELPTPFDDDAWAPAATCGARAGSGGGGFDEELGRRTAVPPTARQPEAAAPASRSSNVEGRLPGTLGLESFSCMLLVGVAEHTAGSFSLSGDIESDTSAAPVKHAPDAAGLNQESEREIPTHADGQNLSCRCSCLGSQEEHPALRNTVK
jgi:hypothetical protein